MRRGYGRFWAGVLPELGFLLLLLPIVIAASTVLSVLFWAGVGMLALVVGVFLVLAALFAARGFGLLELGRLRGAGFPAIVPPRWDRAARGGGAVARTLAPLADGHYWLYLLHGMIVNPVVGIVTWSVAVAWLAAGAGGATFWLWGPRLLDELEPIWARGPDAERVERLADSLGELAFVHILFAVVGAAFLLTLPFVTHGLTWVHHAIARGMLSAFRSEELREQVADLDVARTAAVAAEGAALRRLERDIHDGPQQRLVRLQMDLAAAGRQLDADPDAARALIDEAMQQSREALEELRALSRGFAPPILMDRGLVAALESLAVRSPLPTHIENLLPPGAELPLELERNAYFIAAEALTNVAKHARAANAWVRLELRPMPGGAARLEVVVTDDGTGGASTRPGHGLAGIEERLLGLGGALELVSPVGGPTHVIARLPLPAGPATPAASLGA